MSLKRPAIVIVGGGAGGLALATQLGHSLGRKQSADIILVDKNRTHIWKPLLHEVATGSLDTNLDGVVYSAHAAKHHFKFVLGEFIDLDITTQTITLKSLIGNELESTLTHQQIQFDKLVMAIGSVSNDFNTPGVKEHCFFLDSHAQADRFHHTLLDNFTRIHQSSQNDKPLNIAIVGGGATGVELSAELYHVTQLLEMYGLNNMTESQLQISLIEAGPRILPALSERIANAARRELLKLGVKVLENTQVSSASADAFSTNSGDTIEADIKVWAAGVKGPDFLKDCNCFELTNNNQIKVNKLLQSTVSSDIYVLGDCCAFIQEDGALVPPRAQSAHQMAQCVQYNLTAEIFDQPLKAFNYHDHGSLVNLSKFNAVGNLMGNLTKNNFFIEGKIARIMYMSLYRMHQRAIHGIFTTFILWLSEKMLKIVRPKMKLH